VNGRKKWLWAAELAAVLLATAAAFGLAKQAALAERGYAAYGGEYMCLLTPALYYIGKGMRKPGLSAQAYGPDRKTGLGQAGAARPK